MQAEQSSTKTVDQRRAWRLALLALLATLLIGVGALLAYYLTSQMPITHLPRVVTRSTPPRFLFSIEDAPFATRVAVSRDGRAVYVVQQAGDNSMLVFDRQGTLEYTLAPPNSVPTGRAPVAVTVAQDGRVLVADLLRNAVDVYSPDGEYEGMIRTPEEGEHWAPAGVTIDPDGNIYVTDTATEPPRVVVFDAQYRMRAEYKRQSEKPEQLAVGATAVDGSGRLFVSNQMAGTVDVFGPDGQIVPIQDVGNFKSGLQAGVWIDSLNRLYSVDSINGVVSVYDLDTHPSKLLFKFGDAPGTGALSFPMDVASDVTGRVYVADPGGKRVQVWQY